MISGLRRLLPLVFALGLCIAPRAHDALASDAFSNCSNCPVGQGERDYLTRWLRGFDLVFEGTYVGEPFASPRPNRSRPVVRFHIDRLLRGYATSPDVYIRSLVPDVPAPGTRVLAWVTRECIGAESCGHWVRVTPDRRMTWDLVSDDWRRDSTALLCDSLESGLAASANPRGLDALSTIAALGIAHLILADPKNPHVAGQPGSGIPTNGGTWPVKDVQWLIGSCSEAPRFVRFTADTSSVRSVSEFYEGDQLLVPCQETSAGDTLVVDRDWSALFVKDGLSVRLGVPVDSLASLYLHLRQGFVLKMGGPPTRNESPIMLHRE